jgi:dUTP pyrophosphatase
MQTIGFRFVGEGFSPEQKELMLPRRQSLLASGLDLVAALKDPVVIAPQERALISTGVAFSIPSGFEGQVRTRSGLALKNGLVVLNSPGTIDADYRGEIKVILANFSSEPFTVEFGMRIAQIVFCPVSLMPLLEAEELSETTRGALGFGSTGLVSH